MFTFPACHSSSDILDPLDAIIDSVCCDLDATIAASFTSGQTWANLIAAPADGKNQTDYDAFLGLDGSSSTDDPTFVGPAGNAAAYFDLDSGDYFTFKAIPSGGALANMHRTDVSGTWVAIAFKTGGSLITVARLWGNSAGSIKGANGFYDQTGNNVRSAQGGDSGSVNILPDGGSTVSASTDNLLIISWDGTSSSNNVKLWNNSTTVVDTVSATLNTSTTTTTTNFHIAAVDNGSGPIQPLHADTRVYHFSCGNEFLTDSKVADIFAHLETRHNRDYTP